MTKTEAFSIGRTLNAPSDLVFGCFAMPSARRAFAER